MFAPSLKYEAAYNHCLKPLWQLLEGTIKCSILIKYISINFIRDIFIAKPRFKDY